MRCCSDSSFLIVCMIVEHFTSVQFSQFHEIIIGTSIFYDNTSLDVTFIYQFTYQSNFLIIIFLIDSFNPFLTSPRKQQTLLWNRHMKLGSHDNCKIVTSYRRVSYLQFISKLFKKLLLERLIKCENIIH